MKTLFMMNFKNINFVLMPVLAALLLTSCFERQKNRVTEPETPNYTLRGFVTDVDDNGPVQNVTVKLVPLILSYESDLDSAQVVSDENGQFEFPGLTIGIYSLRFIRDGFTVYQSGYWQDYSDSTMTFPLASGYPIQNIFADDASSRFAIFADTVNQVNYGLSLLKAPFPTQKNLFKLELASESWQTLDTYLFPVDFNDLAVVNLTFGSNPSTIFASHSERNTIYKFTVLGDSLVSSDSVQSAGGTWDVYMYKDRLYVSYLNQLRVLDPQTFQQLDVLGLDREFTWITSVVRSESHFWIADVNQALLFKCDLNLNILKTYIPFHAKKRIFLHDLAIDSDGELWVVF